MITLFHKSPAFFAGFPPRDLENLEELTISLSPSPTRSVVVEGPDAVTLRKRTVKATSFGTAGMHCAAVSLLKRTARLSDILRHMGHGNSGQDPDWVPPSDAEILAAYYRRMMAKQRWTKAQSALSSIRAMQGGLLGAMKGGAAQTTTSPGAVF